MPDNTKVPPEAVENVAYKNVFVGSMTDLFGSWVPKEWIQAVIDQVSAHPEWNFLFLTKFPQRYQEFTFPDNAWLGTTVDRQARVEDAEKAMAAAKAEIKWLSIEPMLTPLHFEKLEIFQWVVMGGASSSTETPEWRVPLEWWLPLHQEAVKLDIHVFHKDHLFRPVREYPGFKPQVIELPPEFEQGKKKKN
jgi:protein gp37